jgi:hypothetical protein
LRIEVIFAVAKNPLKTAVYSAASLVLRVLTQGFNSVASSRNLQQMPMSFFVEDLLLWHKAAASILV